MLFLSCSWAFFVVILVNKEVQVDLNLRLDPAS